MNRVIHGHIKHTLFVHHSAGVLLCLEYACPILHLTLCDITLCDIIEIITQAHDVNEVFAGILFRLIHRVRHVNDAVVLSRLFQGAYVLLESPLEDEFTFRPSFEQETFATIECFEALVLELSYDGCKGHILVKVGGAKHPFAIT